MFQLIFSALTSYRMNIRNFGIGSNAVEVSFTDGMITEPTWYTNSQGVGKTLQGNNFTNIIKIKAVNNGTLHISFLGQDKRCMGEHIPAWIDYKSIKIDGKEILIKPIATWHDKPFKYEMPVKDGQVIFVEFKQQYHKYTEDELTDVLEKLNLKNNKLTEFVNYYKNNIGLIEKFPIKEK